jgi:leucyl aminopeptidase
MIQISPIKPADFSGSQVFLLTDAKSIDALPASAGAKSRMLALCESGSAFLRFEAEGQEHYACYQKADKQGAQVLEKWRRMGVQLAKALNENKQTAATISADEIEAALAVAEGTALASYQFLKYFSDAEKKKNSLSNLYVPNATQADCDWLAQNLTGVFEARNLINEPVITLTATQLAAEAVRLGKTHGFETEVLTKGKIEALKMGGLLAVNYGSKEPPTFTIMTYKPEQAVNENPYVLVGKGVVYDTGGLSLKPTAGSMDSMKSDMSGAAAVMGTMSVIAASKLPVYVIGLVPATDNRPGENAYTPGDVIVMGSGKKVEVLNTDAEGRMILADALHFAKRYKPELVVDLATLTGAAAVAIGKFGIVAMGTADDAWMTKLAESGSAVHERLAVFPFWEEYDELMKSHIADLKNIGGREGGAITAGKFLEHFTDYPWIHLDIAGPAFLDADDHYRLKGGTGVGVRLLSDFFKNRI